MFMYLIGIISIFSLCVAYSKLVIGRETGPYLVRYYIIPRNQYFNIYLHHFLSSDIDDALHDHPWSSVGMLVYGQYYEHLPKDPEQWLNNTSRETYKVKRGPFQPIYRDAKHIHKIELIDNKPVWTIFITGPIVREWGFHCPKKFVSHSEFLTPDGSNVGKGCD